MPWETWKNPDTGLVYGRVWKDADGRCHYYGRKRVDGVLAEKSLATTNLAKAFGELERFERDPLRYQPSGEPRAEAVYLTPDLANEFIDWSRDVLKLSPGWLYKKRKYLAFWTEVLHGKDLRGLSIDVILSKVPQGRTPARPHRIAVLKSLYEYLRNPEQRRSYRPGAPTVKAAEDPTLDLRVPQSKPADQKTPPKLEELRLVLKKLTDPLYRDCFIVLSATGWHTTELDRFAREEGGGFEEIPRELRQDGSVAELLVEHRKGKSPRPKRSRVTQPVLAAAERIRKHGPFDAGRFDKALRAACRAAKVKPFGPGMFRHIVNEYAKSAGVPLGLRAEFLYYEPSTNSRFYIHEASPERIKTPADVLLAPPTRRGGPGRPSRLPARPAPSGKGGRSRAAEGTRALARVFRFGAPDLLLRDPARLDSEQAGRAMRHSLARHHTRLRPICGALLVRTAAKPAGRRSCESHSSPGARNGARCCARPARR